MIVPKTRRKNQATFVATNQPPIRIGAIVLCGGKSSRMGIDKTQLVFQGQTFLERVVEQVGLSCRPIVLVGETDFGLHRLPDNLIFDRDENPGNGPLEGIRVGLKRLADLAEFAFVTSCDVPLLRSALIDHLLGVVGDRQAAVPVEGNRVFGMTAIYRTDLHELIGERINSGQLRVSELAAAVDAIQPDMEGMKQIDPQLDSMTNINTAQDYRRLLDRFGLDCPPELAKRINLAN